MASERSPWEDDPHVLHPNSTDRGFLEYLNLVTDYLSIPICAVAILADILIIVAILKYKRLKNRSNFYVLNFAVFHICYIVSTPLFYIVLDIFYYGELDVHWYCVWIRFENFAISLLLTFAGGFGIDAFLEIIRPSWFEKYERRYLYVFSFLYLSHFLMYIGAACICLKMGFSNNFIYFLTTYYFFILLLIIFYAMYKEKKMENTLRLSAPGQSYGITVSAAIFLCWLPLFVIYNLLNVFRNMQAVEYTFWHLAFLPEYVAYCCSLITVYKLWKSNKHFKVAFRKILRRRVTASEYDELNVNGNEEAISKPL